MYIPNHYIGTDKEETLAFMKQYSFAVIVTAGDNLPVATHLPFVVTTEGDSIILTSHLAKANPQWKQIISSPVLVIFSEPHAYISPAHYDRELNVPTWNYVAVHAYGKGELIEEPENALKLLEDMIGTYEPGYQAQWEKLPDDYKLDMIKGIVAFRIRVTELQAKKKLSQNRSSSEKERIIAAFSKSKDQNEQLIADLMKKEA